jgi:hypothetical protein
LAEALHIHTRWCRRHISWQTNIHGVCASHARSSLVETNTICLVNSRRFCHRRQQTGPTNMLFGVELLP